MFLPFPKVVITIVIMLIFVYLMFCVRFTLAFYDPGRFFDLIFRYQKLCFCRCGISVPPTVTDTSIKGRLFGESSPPHEFPWLALVNIGSKSFVGSLISDRHVITGASVLYGTKAKDIIITLGAYDRCGNDVNPVLNSTVETIILNPGYYSSIKSSDIALLRLTHAVTFSRYILPICMPNDAQQDISQLAWVAGWTHGPNSSCTPSVTVLPTLPMKTCLKTVDSALMTPDKGCLGPIGMKNVICEEDVGTPVMTQAGAGGAFKLLGVTSTSSCEQTTTPLYTRIQDHSPWIYENIRDDCRCF